MRALILAFAILIVAACAPNNIARGSCRSIMLSTADEWSCTVKADVVGRSSSIEYDTESRNHVAHVHIALQVTKGRLRVRYNDLSGSQQVVVTPSEPVNLNMKTRMHRERRSFTLFFEPVDGDVEGLSGTVKYSTPSPM